MAVEPIDCQSPRVGTLPTVPAKPTLILLVRHGATEWSVAGRHTSRTDLPLTNLGMRQARGVGKVIRQWVGDAEPLVYSSPMLRAKQTAALAIPGHHEVELADALMEYDYGIFEGLTTTQILERDSSWDLFTSRGCQGGENLIRVAARCDGFIARLERAAQGRVVVAFTHGHLGRILTARLMGIPASAAAGLWNDTASVAAINLHRDKLVLVGWNITAS